MTEGSERACRSRRRHALRLALVRPRGARERVRPFGECRGRAQRPRHLDVVVNAAYEMDGEADEAALAVAVQALRLPIAEGGARRLRVGEPRLDQPRDRLADVARLLRQKFVSAAHLGLDVVEYVVVEPVQNYL